MTPGGQSHLSRLYELMKESKAHPFGISFLQLLQQANRIFKPGVNHDRRDNVRLKCGLFVGGDTIFLKDGLFNFPLFTGYVGNVRGKAVHVQGLPVPGQFHFLFCAFPALKPSILGKAFFFKPFETLGIVVSH